MDFEVFVGANGKKYYVYDKGRWQDVLKEIARITHSPALSFKCITVWIIRGDSEDLLYLEKVKGSEKKLAAVRK